MADLTAALPSAPGDHPRRLTPAVHRVWHLQNAAGGVVFAAVAAGVLRLPFVPSEWREWEPAVLTFIAAITIVEAAVLVPARYRYYRYAVLADSLAISRGRAFVRRTVLPLHHILYVETSQGPLLRRFGLYDVQLGTIAGTHALGPLESHAVEEVQVLVNSAREATERAHA
ncbi:MAG: PH domain-containing protein [Actinomycetota bacterium]|nr:PH domain-containing protein [Actinomycetota bacterium]